MYSSPNTHERKEQKEPCTWAAVRTVLDRRLQQVAETVSRQVGVSQSLLQRRLLLHLPQFGFQHLCEKSFVLQQAILVAEQIRSLQIDFAEWNLKPNIHTLEKSRFSLAACDRRIAQAIHERFHYIGHYHEGPIHLGLFDERGSRDTPLALASLAPMDEAFLSQNAHFMGVNGSVFQVTRLYAFDCVPRNSISFFFGRVFRWLKKNFSKPTTLLTYINPNLGFSGSSYFASNWTAYAERPPIYSYFQDSYIPYRVFSLLSDSEKLLATRAQYRMEELLILKYELSNTKSRRGASPCQLTTA